MVRARVNVAGRARVRRAKRDIFVIAARSRIGIVDIL